MSFRPQQGLTIMNLMNDGYKLINIGFPSPTGVNYYELKELTLEQVKIERESFRPQQGLTIMNHFKQNKGKSELCIGFRPQQGLTIMNTDVIFSKEVCEKIVSVPNRG